MATKLEPQLLSDEALQLIAGQFRVLSEVIRLKLIIALESGEKNVSALIRATGATQANVSRQLSALADAGVLARRKEGVVVYYRIADPAIFDLCNHVCGSLQRQLEDKAKASALFAPARKRPTRKRSK